jgi:hypothetical protein
MVTDSLHTSLYSGEPYLAIRATNLLAIDDWKAALSGEAEKLRPEVAPVCKPFMPASDASKDSSLERMRDRFSSAVRTELFLTGAGEWRARATTGGDKFVCWPACELEGITPAGNACEEMMLGVASKLVWFDITDRSLVHISIWHMSSFDEFPDPRRRFGVEFIVV